MRELEGGTGNTVDEVLALYEALKVSVSEVSGRIVRISGEAEVLLTKFKDAVINASIGSEEIEEAEEWIRRFKKVLNDVVSALGIRGATLSKEIKSFVEDPRNHLRKKLFIYTHDLLRGATSLSDYLRTASAAVRTSIKTNKRTLYQLWVLLALILKISEEVPTRLIYPEHGYLSLDRSGKQRSGTIPPNAIIELSGKGRLSIFLEAPRPVSWEDSSDLRKYWRLYTALRPDIMIYSGNVTNILNLSSDPPILKPDVIIECKELYDWYLRIRDVRGPFAKPLTAEEWRNKWIRGLWTGLSEVLGVKVDEVSDIVEKRRGIRLREYQVVALYKRVYKPRSMYLISRTPVPDDVKTYLSKEGIVVVDNVGFNYDRISDVAREVMNYAKGYGHTYLRIDDELMRLIRDVSRELGLDIDGRDLGSLLKEVLTRVKGVISKGK